MSEFWQATERHYGERDVILTNDAGEWLIGQSYALYPVDEPPLVEIPSVRVRLYLSVWEARGWRLAVSGD